MLFFKYLFNMFVANAYISSFKTQTMSIKSFYAQQNNYVSLKTLCPSGIRTWAFLFLRRMRCSLRHAARVNEMLIYISIGTCVFHAV
jgi:hypothetical protein